MSAVANQEGPVKAQASRQNTMDLLDELPDIGNGFFSFPVDDFFGNYVEELGQRGMQGALPETGANPAIDSGEFDGVYDSFPTNSNGTSQPLNLGTAMSLELPLLPDPLYPQSAGQMPITTMPVPISEPNGISMPHIGSLPPFGSGSEGSGNWGQPDSQPKAAKRTRATQRDYANDSPDMEDEDHQDDTGGKGNSKTKRNAKQQVQNKQAQQRYRERRKARFQEMEVVIDGLTAKVQHMQAVQSQNAMLQAKRDELEAMLREKDKELERIRAQMESGEVGTAITVAGGDLELRRKAEELNVSKYRERCSEHVKELKEFLDRHNLHNASPTGEGVDPEVVQTLAELVGRGCSMSQNAMRAEGIKVLKLMSRDVAHLTRIQCLRECNKWNKILEKLRMTPVQEEQLMIMRKNHLRNLRQVYEARQSLNMQAMALMLPQPDKRAGAGDSQLEGKMACMSLNGYSFCARQNVDLDSVLDSIKDNLRLEQKNVMEMNFVTMHRVLHPIQAALFLVEVFPAYCDALALANILAVKLDQDTKSNGSDGKSSRSNSGASGELKPLTSGQSEHSPASSEHKSESCRLLRGSEDSD